MTGTGSQVSSRSGEGQARDEPFFGDRWKSVVVLFPKIPILQFTKI
jgi:hypothetical protein